MAVLAHIFNIKRFENGTERLWLLMSYVWEKSRIQIN